MLFCELVAISNRYY